MLCRNVFKYSIFKYFISIDSQRIHFYLKKKYITNCSLLQSLLLSMAIPFFDAFDNLLPQIKHVVAVTSKFNNKAIVLMKKKDTCC